MPDSKGNLTDGDDIQVKAGSHKHDDDAGRKGRLIKQEPDGRVVLQFADANSYAHNYRIEDVELATAEPTPPAEASESHKRHRKAE